MTDIERSPSPLAAAIERFSDVSILCIGDLMLDRFIYGSVERISPEAPIPVFKQEKEDSMLGGAGNVVCNIVSLGASCCFLSVVGDDDTGHQLVRLVGEEARIEPYLVTEKGRISTHKTRYIAGNQQLLRSDREAVTAIHEESRDTLLQIARDEIPRHDVVILSDYAKGVLTPELIKALIKIANKTDIPVMVDPKHRDFSIYKGAFLISPNLKELCTASHHDALSSEEAIAEAAQTLIKKHHINHLLVTRGREGMSLCSPKEATHISAQAREVFDVSGAGDSVIATLATAYACGCSLPEAARLANLAAGIVVGRLGTATIYRTDLKTALHVQESVGNQHKIFPRALAEDQIASWRRDKLTIGFTNGCFDILHTGHVRLLEDARSQCDRLIVGLNSDDSVKRLKGDSRPVNSEIDRALLLASLSPVDMVVIFREDTPVELIEAFRPNILMKGADYTLDGVVGADIVQSYGGEVKLIELVEGKSTSQIISKISA